jgi:hypothetical protein
VHDSILTTPITLLASETIRSSVFIYIRPIQTFRVIKARIDASRGWNLVRAYERLWNFFISYVAVLSEPAQLNFYSDQYSLWKTARAIATGLSIISIEIVASISSSLWMNLYRGSSTLVLLDNGGIVVMYYCIFILTAILSYYITLGTYSRLCFTLFSLVYVTHVKTARATLASG